jgi:hypothetical protein
MRMKRDRELVDTLIVGEAFGERAPVERAVNLF